MSEKKYVLFFINGGLGKNIAATALIEPIKNWYFDRELIVVASWIEPFENNPNIEKVYKVTTTPHLYDKYISGDCLVLAGEPYLHRDYISKEKSLLKTWAEVIGVEYDSAINTPQLYAPNKMKEQLQKKFESFEKPPLLIQPAGGTPKTQENFHNNQAQHIRDMSESLLFQLVIRLRENYTPVLIQDSTRPLVMGAETINLNAKQLIHLPLLDYPAILIDSCLQHSYAAYNKQATVLWSGTDPKLLGYNMHNNLTVDNCLTPRCHRPFFLGDQIEDHKTWQCPYGQSCREHNLEEVLSHF